MKVFLIVVASLGIMLSHNVRATIIYDVAFVLGAYTGGCCETDNLGTGSATVTFTDSSFATDGIKTLSGNVTDISVSVPNATYDLNGSNPQIIFNSGLEFSVIGGVIAGFDWDGGTNVTNSVTANSPEWPCAQVSHQPPDGEGFAWGKCLYSVLDGEDATPDFRSAGVVHGLGGVSLRYIDSAGTQGLGTQEWTLREGVAPDPEEVASVPEPTTAALLALGLLGVGFAGKRRTS